LTQTVLIVLLSIYFSQNHSKGKMYGCTNANKDYLYGLGSIVEQKAVRPFNDNN